LFEEMRSPHLEDSALEDSAKDVEPIEKIK